MGKTWSWCIMIRSKSDHKSMHFFILKSSISPIFVLRTWWWTAWERLLGHGLLFEWIRYWGGLLFTEIASEQLHKHCAYGGSIWGIDEMKPFCCWPQSHLSDYDILKHSWHPIFDILQERYSHLKHKWIFSCQHGEDECLGNLIEVSDSQFAPRYHKYDVVW